MSENNQTTHADDESKIDPGGRGEDAATPAAGRDVTEPTPETVTSPAAPRKRAPSTRKARSNERAASPEPPDDRRVVSPSDQPVDGLALWDSETEGHAPSGLNTVRLDGSETLLVPFTVMMMRVVLHYVGFGAISGYARCNGLGCLLCRIGRQQEVRDLWPVYNLLSKAVEVLAITQNVRPHALRPQLAPLLRQLARGEGPLLISVRSVNNKFAVAALPVPEGADDGAAAIAAFQERTKAGLIDLASAYQSLSNAEWSMIDEVRTFMTAKGLAL